MNIPKSRALWAYLAASTIMLSCTSSDDDADAGGDVKAKAIGNYAEIVYDSYVDARDAGVALKSAVDAFLANPSEKNQDDAKAAWKASRVPYLQTEAYRFYNGPIDNEEDGPEGLLNSWPLDENAIDYTSDSAGAGIVNLTEKFPIITAEVISGANGAEGETAITTGYHAIEFLLWGQDRDAPALKTAGKRPYTDYVIGEGGTAANQDRRREYLKVATQLLVDNLNYLVEAWKPGASNYRVDFFAANADSSLAKIVTGIGSLSSGELPHERMAVALELGDQEDEHSCFSDNTHTDVIQDVQGISNVFNGTYTRTNGTVVSGISIYDVLKAKDAALADKLKGEIAASLAKSKLIEVPFDLAISLSNATGRATVQTTIDALNAQAKTIGEAATALGLGIVE